MAKQIYQDSASQASLREDSLLNAKEDLEKLSILEHAQLLAMAQDANPMIADDSPLSNKELFQAILAPQYEGLLLASEIASLIEYQASQPAKKASSKKASKRGKKASAPEMPASEESAPQEDASQPEEPASEDLPKAIPPSLEIAEEPASAPENASQPEEQAAAPEMPASEESAPLLKLPAIPAGKAEDASAPAYSWDKHDRNALALPFEEGPRSFEGEKYSLPAGFRIYGKPGSKRFYIAELMDGEYHAFGRDNDAWHAASIHQALGWIAFNQHMGWHPSRKAKWDWAKEEQALFDFYYRDRPLPEKKASKPASQQISAQELPRIANSLNLAALEKRYPSLPGYEGASLLMAYCQEGKLILSLMHESKEKRHACEDQDLIAINAFFLSLKNASKPASQQAAS